MKTRRAIRVGRAAAREMRQERPEQLHLELPHLSLGQIHSALAYYWDHKAELDVDIDRRRERVEQLRRETPEPPVVERLRKLRRS